MNRRSFLKGAVSAATLSVVPMPIALPQPPVTAYTFAIDWSEAASRTVVIRRMWANGRLVYDMEAS